jgi:hypothetical protein
MCLWRGVCAFPRNLLPPKAKEGSWLTLDILGGQPQNIKLDEKETATMPGQPIGLLNNKPDVALFKCHTHLYLVPICDI